MRRFGIWRRVFVVVNGIGIRIGYAVVSGCFWTLLFRNRRVGRGELEVGIFFAFLVFLICFFGFYQSFFDVVRRRMESGRGLGVAYVVFGIDAVFLLWNLYGREIEVKRGQLEFWRVEERCVWDLRRFCFLVIWRFFYFFKVVWNVWKFYSEEVSSSFLVFRFLFIVLLLVFNFGKWDLFLGV